MVYAAIAAASVMAGVIQSVTGFGSAVFLMLIVPYFYDMVAASAISSSIAMGLGITLAWKFRAHLQWKKVILPAVFYLAGRVGAIQVLGGIDLPDSVEYIGRAAFYNSTYTSAFRLPANLKVIGDYAFAYCDKLSYVTIPAGVTDFGAKVFYECPKLGAIAFRGDAPAFREFAFEDTTLTAYYPADNATWTEEVRQNYGGTVTWVAYEPMDFIDVPVNSFYYESVLWAVKKGITNGATATTFNPFGVTNRAQAAVIFQRFDLAVG